MFRRVQWTSAESKIKPLFTKDTDIGFRMFILGILSIALLVADYRFKQMESVRSVLSTLVAPIQIVVDMPAQVWNWANRISADYDDLHEENAELKAQSLVLQRKLQKMAALTVENIRLRELLQSSAVLDEAVMVAEVIGVDPEPFTHELIINKGRADGAFVGQALLDAHGVMGQIINVNRYTSRALLITDSRHATPVQVNRTGVRAIAAGNGVFDELELLHLPDTADIKKGDVLLTSALGGRFPYGYPVAVVDRVRRDPGQPFAVVSALPTAQLTRSREVILVLARAEPKRDEGPAIIIAEPTNTVPGEGS